MELLADKAADALDEAHRRFVEDGEYLVNRRFETYPTDRGTKEGAAEANQHHKTPCGYVLANLKFWSRDVVADGDMGVCAPQCPLCCLMSLLFIHLFVTLFVTFAWPRLKASPLSAVAGYRLSINKGTWCAYMTFIPALVSSYLFHHPDGSHRAVRNTPSRYVRMRAS